MKEKHSEADRSASPAGNETQKAIPPSSRDTVAPSENQQNQALENQLDRLGSIMTQSLDLAEVGIGLGIKLAGRLSSALQLQLGDGLERAVQPPPRPRFNPGEGPVSGPAPAYQSEPERPAARETPPPMSYIVNRLPLLPGSPVWVSFTINNDSVTAPKELRLHVEGFVGEMHGAPLDGSAFSVEPATRVVAPLDFDKFTLRGILPPDTVPDAYAGWMVVSAEQALRIPIRLIVTAPA